MDEQWNRSETGTAGGPRRHHRAFPGLTYRAAMESTPDAGRPRPKQSCQHERAVLEGVVTRSETPVPTADG